MSILFILSVIVGFILTVRTVAGAINSDEVRVTETDNLLDEVNLHRLKNCTNKMVRIQGTLSLDGLQYMCVHDAKDYSLAQFVDKSISYNLFMSVGGEPFIGIDRGTYGGISSEYAFTIHPGSNKMYSLGTDPTGRYWTLVSRSHPHESVKRLVGNGGGYLNNNQFNLLYALGPATTVLKNDLGQPAQADDIELSADYRYMMVYSSEYGLIRIDLSTYDESTDTYRMTLVTSERWVTSGGYAMSDTGLTVGVARGVADRGVWLYDLSTGCGVVTEVVRPTSGSEWCEKIDITSSLDQYLRENYPNRPLMRGSKKPAFIDDSIFLVGDYPHKDGSVGALQLHFKSASPPSASQQLDYLALGDSFSSGEGDIGRKSDGSSYYLLVTDYTKGCHISTRSYPFALRQTWGIAEDKMKSVACSGAQVLPDYYGRLGGYLGQGGRLKGINDIVGAQDIALQNFIPGRVPQIEFVKKYQPKIITLTGGGNDVGFGRILSDCASVYWEDYWRFVPSDCSYAVEGSGARSSLLDAIDTQFLITKQLINGLKSASPESKIIVIGYPSFVYDGLSGCEPANVGNLSANERRMVNGMTSRLNRALQRAAHDTGVSFVDIGDSLKGGRLCEGSAYMTGVWDGIRGRAIDEERFHPNAEGHARIAKAIEQSGVFSHDTVPDPGFFKPATTLFKPSGERRLAAVLS